MHAFGKGAARTYIFVGGRGGVGFIMPLYLKTNEKAKNKISLKYWLGKRFNIKLWVECPPTLPRTKIRYTPFCFGVQVPKPLNSITNNYKRYHQNRFNTFFKDNVSIH